MNLTRPRVRRFRVWTCHRPCADVNCAFVLGLQLSVDCSSILPVTMIIAASSPEHRACARLRVHGREASSTVPFRTMCSPFFIAEWSRPLRACLMVCVTTTPGGGSGIGSWKVGLRVGVDMIGVMPPRAASARWRLAGVSAKETFFLRLVCNLRFLRLGFRPFDRAWKASTLRRAERARVRNVIAPTSNTRDHLG